MVMCIDSILLKFIRDSIGLDHNLDKKRRSFEFVWVQKVKAVYFKGNFQFFEKENGYGLKLKTQK